MGVNIHKEVEVKLRVEDSPALRRKLARLKARPAPGGRTHERNTLYDTPQGGLAKHGQLLRIRVEEPARKAAKAGKPGAILTYKGPATGGRSSEGGAGRYKVREEIEVGVGDPQRMKEILEALGLRGWFRYEKYRTTYRLPSSIGWAAGLHLELDETPIGVYLELEGPPEAIDRAAGLLGYRRADYITTSYLALHLSHCRKQGLPAGDMTFSAGKK